VRNGICRNFVPQGITPSTDLIALSPEHPDRDPLRVYLAGLAPGSRRAMAQALDQVARVVSSEAWRLGQMSAEDYHRAADLERVRGATVLRGRALEPNEVAALFHALQRDPSPAGARDAAVLALGLAGGGLRRAELSTLELPRSLDQSTWVLTVDGKGSRVREVPLKNGCVDALRAWLSHRGHKPGPLLCPVLKGGHVRLRRLSEEAIYRICARRAQEAGVPPFTPHDMRRTYISTLLDRGVDLSIVSQLVGHASGPAVTARYDRRDERAKHAAAEAITVPYVFTPERPIA
jgi:integrase